MKKDDLAWLLNDWEKEYKFAPKKRWRFDYALPDKKLAVEYEGVNADKSRHTSLKGYTGDCKKYNTAALLGWTVLRYTVLSKFEDFVADMQTCEVFNANK